MKYLLLPLLLLLGCQATWPPPSPLEKPDPPPTIIASGTNGQVEWRCQLSELSPAVVQCDFRNPLKQAVPSACLTVAFFDEESHKLVVESRKVCSGPLPSLGTNTNYVAFQKENRVALG